MRTRNIDLRMRGNLKRTSSKMADLRQGAGFQSCDDLRPPSRNTVMKTMLAWSFVTLRQWRKRRLRRNRRIPQDSRMFTFNMFVNISALKGKDVCRLCAVMAAQDTISTELRAGYFHAANQVFKLTCTKDIFRANRSAWMSSARPFVRIASSLI